MSSPAGANDLSALLAACHGGDTAAFHQLYQRFAGSTVRYLQHGRMSGDPYADVEDVAAETWTEVWKSLLKTVPDHFPAWLFAITNRRAATYIDQRAADRKRIADVYDSGPPDAPDDSMVDLFRMAEMRGGERWLRELLQDALDSLPEKYHAVLRARIDTRADTAELASILGLATRQATRSLSDGLPLLRDCMVLTLMARGTAGLPCSRFRTLVDQADWHGGPLGNTLRETLTRHVAHCPECQGVRANIYAGLRYIPAFLGPPVLVASLDEIRSRLRLDPKTPDQPTEAGHGDDSRTGRRRLGLLALMLIVLVVALTFAFVSSASATGRSTASASLSGCRVHGSATSASGAGTDTVNAPGGAGASSAHPFVVDYGGTVAYQAHSDSAITDNHWHVDLYGVTIASGGAGNAHRVQDFARTAVVGNYLPIRITGLYYVSGGINGTSGACAGAVWIRIAGNPAATAPFWAAVILLEVGVVGLWWSRRRSRREVST